MGRGGAKHSKNRCSGQGGSGFTADEKNKANAAQAYGTITQRLSGDSLKDWDCCSLSLQPCAEPVVTPEGVLYDKEAIYSYILKEKQRIAQEVKAWKAQQTSKPLEERAKRQAEVDEATRQFEEAECGILPMSKKAKTGDDVQDKFDTLAAGKKDIKDGAQKAHGSALGHKSLLEGELMSKQAKDTCFWIPDLTPEARAKEIGQPDERVYCPISRKPIRLKDLIAVKFTPLDKTKNVTVNNTNANERFMCPISFKTLSNATPAAVLRNTGKCIAMDVVTNVIKKDMIDPFGGGKLKEKDIVPLMRGGTGFAGSGLKLTAQIYNPVMRSY